MSRKIAEKYRRIVASEEGSPTRRGGSISVCLVYPNRYEVAMSNLGFQAVHALLNREEEATCERAFLPAAEELEEYRRSGTRLLSLESARPLSGFDLVAFSVSFESDYLNIPLILDLAGIEPLAADRGNTDPLVIGGGAAFFLNPEPAADFIDLVCIGEAEPLLRPLLELVAGAHDRQDCLLKGAAIPGLYVPSLYRLSYEGERIASREPLPGAPATVTRQWERDLDSEITSSSILAPGTEFSDMYLLEVSRGCPRGCRFCAAGFIYRPYRRRSLEKLAERAAQGLASRSRIGLVGAAVSDHPDIGRLCAHIIEHGGTVSLSSLRIDALDEAMLEALKKSGHRTVALAPEGGSQRLRDLVRKNLSEPQILEACEKLISSGILNLKLYFIIGLPTETFEDLEEMVALVRNIRSRVLERARGIGRLGDIILSVNPFVPKPFTPLQWCGMENLKSLEKKVAFLRKSFGPMPNVSMQTESLREAWLQALLSRGDRRLSGFMIKASREGSWKKAARTLEPAPDLMTGRNIPLDDTLPWDFIEHDRELLKREFRAALGGTVHHEQ